LFVLATLKELQLGTLNIHVFTLCSARVSASVIMLSDSSCERITKWETCPILKEDIVAVSLAGASVTKTAPLLGVSRGCVDIH
jgi:hypothetical protein